jgi:hypothetical protein
MNRRVLTAVLFLACLATVGNLIAQSSVGPETSVGAPPPTLTVRTYASAEPMTLSASDLRSMPHIAVTFHNSHTNTDETYSGIRLAEILAKLKAPLGNDLRGPALANYVVATGSDGYKAVLALAELDPSFHPGEVVIADGMDGKPLDEHNGPLKLVVTEDKRPARAVRNLVEIDLKTLG